MRFHQFFTIVSGVAVSGLLASTPVFAQSSDQPIIATITVPVELDFLDTEQLTAAAPTVTCRILGTGPYALAAGSTAIPMVSTQATATSRSISSFSGNVVVTLRSQAAGMGAGVASPEAAAQAGAKLALQEAKSYECFLSGPTTVLAGFGSAVPNGPKWTASIVMGGKTVEPIKHVLSVKGTVTPKP